MGDITNCMTSTSNLSFLSLSLPGRQADCQSTGSELVAAGARQAVLSYNGVTQGPA